jgi:hypothetical protein
MKFAVSARAEKSNENAHTKKGTLSEKSVPEASSNEVKIRS